MKAAQVRALDRRLESFLEDLVRPMRYCQQRRWAGVYIRGLLLDGERKSIEPIATRTGADVQALRQFVGQSPWEVDLVQQALVRRITAKLPRPFAWILDETAFPKQGKESVGVAYQYCGTLAKIANCQVAVTLSYAAAELSFPVGWRLFLPEEWTENAERRKKVKIPDSLGFARKNDLAVELVEEALRRGLPKAPVLADAAYGCDCFLRERLRELGCEYVMALNRLTKVWKEDPAALPAGRQRPEAQDLRETARSLPAEAWKRVTWREGTKGPMRSRFALVKVWAAKGAKGGRAPKQRAAEWLLVEWPKKEKEPVEYWLCFFAEGRGPRLKKAVRLAKGRWRIEQEYRELKGELGLDHYEGRHWAGWHHHVTLVSMAYAFLRFEQLRGKKSRDEHAAHGPPESAEGAHPPERLLPLVRREVPQLLLNN